MNRSNMTRKFQRSIYVFLEESEPGEFTPLVELDWENIEDGKLVGVYELKSVQLVRKTPALVTPPANMLRDAVEKTPRRRK